MLSTDQQPFDTVNRLSEFIENFWNSVQKELLDKHGPAIFKSWFSHIKVYNFRNGELDLSVPTTFFQDWIRDNYLNSIAEVCANCIPDLRSVKLVVAKQDQLDTQFNLRKPAEESTYGKFSENRLINIPENNPFKSNFSFFDTPKSDVIGSALDPRLKFENFVVGSSNELAYAAARAVSEAEDAVAESNPLFLHGGVGLGKTHLMHAIAWQIQINKPHRKVVYMTAEKFMYQFVRSLRNREIMIFKDYFRSVDVLMIDDIQFICGKDSTQEEFFHTFNALIDNNKQMIISCDCSPSDLDDIEERIKSRLGWGLVVDVHSTTYELRLGILQSKVDLMGISISDQILEFLASKISSNVRELEGALNKVLAHSSLIGHELTLEACQYFLKDLIRSKARALNLDDVLSHVANYYKITIEEMISGKRSKNIVKPRQIAMYLCKLLTVKSLADIGKKFLKKDHTTVLHAIKTIEQAIDLDIEIKKDVNKILNLLQ